MTMKRRDFLKNSALASSVFFVPSFVKAMDGHLLAPTSGFRRLVIIQLTGGNDGLNTIIPYRNDIYFRSRPVLGIKKNNAIRLTDELGFNENMKELKELYDNGNLCVINNVGYPNPDRSHFRSTDIWHTASGSEKVLNTGWVGRFLDNHADKAHEAIEIGNSLSLLMKGKTLNGTATLNPRLLHRIAADPYFDTVLSNNHDSHLSEHNMGYLYRTMIDAKQSASYIYEKVKVYKSDANYSSRSLGRQLRTIAQFINSGLNTKVYYASFSGFDTHAGQPRKQGKLLKEYSEGISTLVKDLKKNNTFKDTLILTFSEFGRRVEQNAANGTDHGAANNVFVIGDSLRKPGLFNGAPDLTDLDDNGDIKYEIDFRSIYANILEDWLQVPTDSILTRPVPPVRIV